MSGSVWGWLLLFFVVLPVGGGITYLNLVHGRDRRRF